MQSQLLSLLWLLPVVFMLHDFEEIIMGKAWMRHAENRLRRLLPAFAFRALSPIKELSTSAFSLAVAEEFLLITGLTWLCITYEWYGVWMGMLIGFFLHLLVHVAQAFLFRGYIPALLTSIPASAYCVYAIIWLANAQLIPWTEAAVWSVIATILIVFNLMMMLRIAIRFDAWLQRPTAG
jgi:hypothetical protein